MIISRRKLFLALATTALLGTSAEAHPVYDLYDLTTELLMTGTVLRFEYTEPHSWLYISVHDEAGAESRWAFEMNAAALLRRSGIRADQWQEGEAISVRANPMKDGRMAGLLLAALGANGRGFGETGDLEPPPPP